MASINKVILIGNLGKDPEMRYMPSGDPIANVSIATTEVFKDRDGIKQERTEWHRVVFFGKLAEIVGQYLKKGRSVYVEGRIQTRKWQDQSGQDRYSTEIIANEMKMLGGRGDDTSSAPFPGNMPETSAAPSSAVKPVRSPAASTATPQPSLEQDFDDDIPF